MKKRLLFFGLVLFVASSMLFFCVNGQNPKIKQKNFTHVAIFLESRSKYKVKGGGHALLHSEAISLFNKKDLGGITETLIDAISQNVEVIVASSALVKILLYLNEKDTHFREAYTVNKFFKNMNKEWKIYKASGKNKKGGDLSFGVFIRNSKDKDIDLEKLGLSKDLVLINDLQGVKKHFSVSSIFIKSTIELESLRTTEVGVKILNNIFVENDILAKNVPKLVFIMGHGLGSSQLTQESKSKENVELFEGISIAQLTHVENQEFLQRMSETGCYFLYYNSCYVGGLNTVLMDKVLKEISSDKYKLEKNININFPIVSGSISDSRSIRTAFMNVRFDLFFERLETFFGTRLAQEDSIKSSMDWIEKPFRNIVEMIGGKTLENSSSILLPGVRVPIKTIKVDDEVLVITYPYLIEHELRSLNIKSPEYRQKKLTEEEKKKLMGDIEKKTREKFKKALKEKKGKYKKEIKQRKYKKEPMPIEIGNKKAVLIYPMILHVPLKIERDIPLIISMIPGKAYHYISKVDIGNSSIKNFVSHAFKFVDKKVQKLFFIKELFYKGKKVENLFILKKNKGKVFCFYLDKLYGVTEWRGLNGLVVDWKKIKSDVTKFKNMVTPLDVSLRAATGGIENQKQFDTAFDKVLWKPKVKVRKIELVNPLEVKKVVNALKIRPEGIPKEYVKIIKDIIDFEKNLITRDKKTLEQVRKELYKKLKVIIEKKGKESIKSLFRLAMYFEAYEVLGAIVYLTMQLYSDSFMSNKLGLSQDEMKRVFVPCTQNIIKEAFGKGDKVELLKKLKEVGETSFFGLAIMYKYFVLTKKHLTTFFEPFDFKLTRSNFFIGLGASKKQISLAKGKLYNDVINKILNVLSIIYYGYKRRSLTMRFYFEKDFIGTFPRAILNNNFYSNLESLMIYGLGIKALPKEIGKLVSLRELNLINDKIKVLPKEIGKLVNLKYLSLNENQLKKLPREIGNLGQLEALSLYKNNTKMKLPEDLKKLKNLKRIDLIGVALDKESEILLKEIKKSRGRRNGITINF